MTLRCLFLGCDWRRVVPYAGIRSLNTHICVRCGAKKVVA